MRIQLNVGDKIVTIDKDYEEGEDGTTWLNLMEELIFPALRGFGYIIDDEFSNSMDEIHSEYLDRKHHYKHKR
jgi:hypothetical protein